MKPAGRSRGSGGSETRPGIRQRRLPEAKRSGAPGAIPGDRSEFAEWLEALGLVVLRVLYRIETEGAHHLPARGGVLLAGSHLTWFDVPVLVAATPRPLRFVAGRDMFDVPMLGWFMRQFRAVPIAPRQAKDAVRTTVEEVARGSAVCVFPEGGLSRSGLLGAFQPGIGLIARRVGEAPVGPFYIDGLWGSVFSYSEGRFFWKRPERIRRRVTVYFAPPLRDRRRELSDLRSAISACAWKACRRRGSEEADLWSRLCRAWNRNQVWCAEATGGRIRRWLGPELLEAAAQNGSDLGWLSRGTRVAVCAEPSLESAALHLALVRLGCIPIAVATESAGYDPASCSALLEETGAAALAWREAGSGWQWERRPQSSLSDYPGADAAALAVSRGGRWRLHRFDAISLAAGIIQLRETLAFRREEVVLCPRSFTRPGLWWAGWWLPLLQGWPMVFAPEGEAAEARALGVTVEVADRRRAQEWIDEPFPTRIPRHVLHFEADVLVGTGTAGGERRKGRPWFLRGLDDPVSGCVLALSTPDPVYRRGQQGLPGLRAGSCGRLLKGVDVRVNGGGQEGRANFDVITPAWDKTAPGSPAVSGLAGWIDPDGFVFAEETA